MFVIWLNDTSPRRYYWIGGAVQNWSTDLSQASTFETEAEAQAEADYYASRTTKSEVVVQEITQ